MVKDIKICFLLSDYINSFQIQALKKGFIFQQGCLKMRLKKVALIKEEYPCNSKRLTIRNFLTTTRLKASFRIITF